MTTLCALLLTLMGGTLIYLASDHQKLRGKRLPAMTRLIGWALILAGTLCWRNAEGIGAGLAAALTTLMLTWVLLPYLAWWRTPATPENPAR